MDIYNKKVFITGSEGFIGSHLTELLVHQGAKVTCLVQYNSFNSWGWLESLSEDIQKEIQVVTGDIREFDGINKLIAGNEVVFHLAALIAIPYSYQTPMSYVRTNVEGTLNVMEASKTHGVSKILHTSTSEVYGTADYVPIDEKHPLKGQSPYSASKISADKMAESYFNSFDLPVATVRPFNTYGPRQSARAIIPTIIGQILSGKNRIKLGDLTPTRDLNYVKDTVKGILAVAQSDQTIGQTINIGSGVETSMSALVDKIVALTGSDIVIEQDDSRLRPTKSEVMRLVASNEKIVSLTDWRPSYTLEEGLTETIEWMSKHLSLFKTDIYNV